MNIYFNLYVFTYIMCVYVDTTAGKVDKSGTITKKDRRARGAHHPFKKRARKRTRG